MGAHGPGGLPGWVQRGDSEHWRRLAGAVEASFEHHSLTPDCPTLPPHRRTVYMSKASNAVRVARSVADVGDLPRIASGEPKPDPSALLRCAALCCTVYCVKGGGACGLPEVEKQQLQSMSSTSASQCHAPAPAPAPLQTPTTPRCTSPGCRATWSSRTTHEPVWEGGRGARGPTGLLT